MTTQNKKSLREIPAGTFFATASEYGSTVYVRGETRWASYQFKPDGTERHYSTRHDGRERMNVFASKAEAMAFAEAHNKTILATASHAA